MFNNRLPDDQTLVSRCGSHVAICCTADGKYMPGREGGREGEREGGREGGERGEGGREGREDGG